MGNEESREQPKPRPAMANTNTHATVYQQTPPTHNAQNPTAGLNSANNNPSPGWVMPPTAQNSNTQNIPSQTNVYPNLPPPPYNAVNPMRNEQPQHPPAPPKFCPQPPNRDQFRAQPTAPPTLYSQAPTQHQFRAQPAAPPQFYPQTPTNSIITSSSDAWSKERGIPLNAFRAGHDTDGIALYICRAAHDGDLLTGKIVPTHNCAYVSYDGKEISKSDFETLIGNHYRWVLANNGHVPAYAVEGGRTSRGEKMYIGRVSYKGALTPGKIHPSHGCLYIPYGGKEHGFKEYEVLVHSTY